MGKGVAEIRPRKDRRGFNLQHGELGLWYRELEHAISYAKDCTDAEEVIVYDEKGAVVQRLSGRGRGGGNRSLYS